MTSGSFNIAESFNPCFNGSMYKNKVKWGRKLETIICFNPCFNGSMYKNRVYCPVSFQMGIVSILVLMDLCIKTQKTIDIKIF